MSSNFSNENMGDAINQKKLKRMAFRIYQLERENTKTGKRSEKEMKNEIQRIIEEEEAKCY